MLLPEDVCGIEGGGLEGWGVGVLRGCGGGGGAGGSGYGRHDVLG